MSSRYLYRKGSCSQFLESWRLELFFMGLSYSIIKLIPTCSGNKNPIISLPLVSTNLAAKIKTISDYMHMNGQARKIPQKYAGELIDHDSAHLSSS